MTAGLQLKIRSRMSPGFFMPNFKNGGDEIAVFRKSTFIVQIKEG